MRTPLWTAHAQIDYAALLLERGGPDDRARATALLVAATNAAETAGSERALRRIAALSPARVAASPAPDSVDPPDALFRREGQFWTIAYGRREFHLRDTKGLAYLAHLLRHPGRDFHALELMALVDGGDGGSAKHDRREPLHADRGEGQPLGDLQALASYRRRLREVIDEIGEADATGDMGRVALLREEGFSLEAELARGWGLGDRARRVGSAAERARLNVTRAIKAALGHIADQHAELGAHLGRTVRTGTFCSYHPDPRAVPAWQL